MGKDAFFRMQGVFLKVLMFQRLTVLHSGDPRNSEIDIIQAVGRAIRLSKDKNIGTIVIPVFIDENEDSYEVINSSPFKVWAVVNALRAHDEDLGEKLDQLRQELSGFGVK